MATLLALASLLLASFAAHAASVDSDSGNASSLIAGAPVEVQVSVGFSGVFRLDRWTPVIVTLDNRGPDLVGQVEVRVPDGDTLGESAFTTTHRRRVELPADSRKRFSFTVYLTSFSRPLEISVTDGAGTVAEERVDLRTAVTDARLILVHRRDADLDYLNDPRGRRVRVVYPRPERLPDRWTGYHAVSAVLVHGVSLESLSTRQHDALRKWVSHGGVLAVSGGPDYSLLRTPRLAALLPGVPSGLVRLPDGLAAGKALGAPLPAARPFDVNRVLAYEGRVLRQANDTPLVIERPFGRGRILYLTFDVARYPFREWPGMTRLWHALLDLPPVEPLSARLDESREASALPSLIKESRLDFPDHFTILAFLALYMGLLVTVYQLRPSSSWGRRVLPWLTWTTPALFAPVAFLVFGPLLFPSGATAVVVAVIEPYPQGPSADLKLEVGLYSNTSVPLRLRYLSPEPAFRLVRPHRRKTAWGGGKGPKGEVINWVHEAEAGGGAVQPQTRDRYVLHKLEGRDVITHDLKATLTERRDGLELRAMNLAGRTLEDAWLVFDGHVYGLASIPSGVEWVRTLSPEAGVVLHDRSWRKLIGEEAGSGRSGLDARVAIIDRELAILRTHDRAAARNAVLLGFTANPLQIAGASAHWQYRALTLVLLRVPVARLPRAARASGASGQSGRFAP